VAANEEFPGDRRYFIDACSQLTAGLMSANEPCGE
jgi:hypothetical protein